MPAPRLSHHLGSELPGKADMRGVYALMSPTRKMKTSAGQGAVLALLPSLCRARTYLGT